MAMDTSRNSEPVASSPQATRRGEMKAVLFVLGLSGVAAMGAVKNWEAIKHASGPAVQKIQDVSDAAAQKVEVVSGAVAQKVEDVSAPVMQKIQDVSGTVAQMVSAAIDNWQDQRGQTTANRSRAIVSGTDASAATATMVERTPAPTNPGAERSQILSTEPDTSAATLVERSPAPNVASNAERPGPLSTAPDVSTGSLFGVGDRLKVAFFERVVVEEDKWGAVSSASALSGIQQRPELSGEYTVQEDGTISVPLLGFIPVANRSAQQVQADLVETFDRLLGRKGLVNILSLERSPIYVLGPVKNPGSFKYTPGMTILHAIALAGGLNQGQSEPWQNIEAVRETQKRGGAIDAIVKLLARAAVLEAERDGTAPKTPPRLLELAGATEATNLINEQSDRRKAVTVARKYRERATLDALETAKQDVMAYGQMDSLDELVKLRQERVNSTRMLVNRKVLSTTVLDQVQSELSDAEQRRREALNQYASARQRLISLESQVLQTRADARNDLEVEIEATDSQIAANVRELNASEGVLYTLPATRAQFAAQFAQDANRVTYQIVRQSAAGPVSIQSMGMTVLRPGDLVNITVGENQPSERDGSSVQASSPSGDRLPGASTLNELGHGPVVAEQMMGPN
ncbi:polysaccharide biosynthesis/export family protein [Mesorhizobium sp. WSM3626]|uniref:polysaccharide biosynthesis/export family protein n=1 Tax=Mesorhizobium sp. WSM3626 TaxID=1040987 RepID=UPI0004AFD3CF|nr:polysaccharide biosynthesis/export family protein [Mesorhizobium sp. WSM3626]